MIPSGVDQLHALAAERQLHALGVEDVGLPDVGLQLRRRERTVAVAIGRLEESSGHAAAAAVVRQRIDDLVQLEAAVVVAVQHVTGHLRDAPVHVPRDVLVRHDASRVGEHGSAFDVVPVTVAVDHVADRHLEPLGELLLQPGGERRVDRVREDDAVGRDQEDGEVVVAAGAIEIPGDLDDLTGRTARWPLGGTHTGEGSEHQSSRG